MLQISQELKAILFDVDGVLTNARITIDGNGDVATTFNIRDGQLIQFMRDKGFVFGAISGRDSKAVQHRMEMLKIEFVRLGQGDKLSCYEEFKKEFKLNDDEIAYIGDDVIDIEVMEKAGLALCPADASHYVMPYVDHVTHKRGGDGVLRELIEEIIQARGWNKWKKGTSRIGFNKIK